MSTGQPTDLVVVGGGVAGLYAALCAAVEADVVLLSKGPLLSSTSFLAQGGVAAAASIAKATEIRLMLLPYLPTLSTALLDIMCSRSGSSSENRCVG